MSFDSPFFAMGSGTISLKLPMIIISKVLISAIKDSKVSIFGRVIALKKHFQEYKASQIELAEVEFYFKKSGSVVKRGRGRPKKLPNFAGLGV